MSNNGPPPTNYMNYYGADTTPLLNFYMAQKQHDMLKEHEARAKEVISQHNKMLAQTRFQPPMHAPVPVPTTIVKKIEDDEEFKAFERSLPPCELHPVKSSPNCRKCKKRKESKIKKLQELLKEKQEKHPEITYTSNEIVVPTKVVKDKPSFETEIGGYGVFSTYGDPIACNMNDLLRNNIINAQYFRELQELTTCEEIMGQIEYYCKHAEPFTLGTNNIPSTLFCCLYKLMLMKLTESQVNFLLNAPNPYVKATGALYVRYIGKPEELWRRLSGYLLDEQVFAPSADAEYKVTFGEFIEKILSDLNYYGTRLPRLPILIEKDIRKKLALAGKKRERMQFNKENYNLFVKGAECYCLSTKDYNWHYGIIVNPDIDMKFIKVKIFPRKDEGETEQEYEENMDLGSVILTSCIQSGEEDMEEKSNDIKDKRKKSRSRSRDRSRRHHRHHKHSRRSRSRSRSRSRDRDKMPSKGRIEQKPVLTTAQRNEAILDKLNEENKSSIEEAFENEREQVLASNKNEYARRPASYKSALSLALPVGTVRKKSKSASPERKVVEIKLVSRAQKTKTEELEEKAKEAANKPKQESAEYYERMRRIKEKYGGGEVLVNKGKKVSDIKGRDDAGPDIVKFGIRK